MVDELGEGEEIENILVGEGEEIKDETAGEGELSKELKDEGSKYTDFIGKCMKTGKTMKQCAVLWKKEKPATEEKDVWSGFNEKEMEAELENLMKAQMAAPTMTAIVYAMKKAGVSESDIKKTMDIIREKYPSPYPGKAKDDIGNLPEIKKKVEESEKEGLEAENKTLKEKVEQMSKLDRKSVKGETKREELAEDEVYAHILKGIGGV